MTPTSATGDKKGFTLVEVMVAVAIVGIAATFVVMTLPRADADVGRQAEVLAAKLVRARQEAVIGGKAIEARLTPLGYRFEAAGGGERTVLEGPFREAQWPLGIKAYQEQHGRIVFDPTGAAQGGRIVLTRDGRAAEIVVEANGKVTVHAPEG